jgi:hypothetical protein
MEAVGALVCWQDILAWWPVVLAMSALAHSFAAFWQLIWLGSLTKAMNNNKSASGLNPLARAFW